MANNCVQVNASALSVLLSIAVFIVTTQAVTISPDCPILIDSLGRLVYNCSGRHFDAFPTNIPTNILVLTLRRTMLSPTVPSFHSIGLAKLQVLDLSWNLINYLSNDTFEGMTSLLSLDIRGNNILTFMTQGLFKYFVKLDTLKVDGFNSYNITKYF